MLVALSTGSMFVSGSAGAAGLSGPVSGWNSGVPGYISMYEYVPTKLASPAPVVVAAHYCGGSASAMFGFTGMPAIEAAADKYGFIIVFPQTANSATSAKCWEVGSKASLTHDGGGDTQAIAQMVKYEVSKRGADASRAYMMGASSGAMLTEAMLAVYPDVFKAGAEFSGVPAGCWSAGWSAASNWGGTCANGSDSMSAQAWGDLARGMYPGYTGYRPRIQLWHGTNDTTINKNNQTEAIKQWTNVLGVSTAPTSSTMASGFTIEKWQNSCGFTVLEAHTQASGGHTTPIDATSVIGFFGLDKPGADPQIAICGSSGNGGAGGTGSSGAGGNTAGGGFGGSNAGGSSAGGGTSGGAAGGGLNGGAGASSNGTGGAGGSISGGAGAASGGASMTGTGTGTAGAGASGNTGNGTAGSAIGEPDPNDSSGGCAFKVDGVGSRGAASLALLGLTLAFVRRIRRRR